MIAILFALLLGTGDLERAERAYHDALYGEALARFQSELPKPESAQGPILYDMGNCAFRLGRFAEAALHYRRAQLRIPRDPRVTFNLRLAERRLGIGEPSRESFLTAVASLIGWITPRELFALVVGFETVGLVGFVLVRRRRAARRAMAVVVLVALAGGARLAALQWFAAAPDGVVLAPEIALRAEPRVDTAIQVKLEAGEVVRIEESSDRWVRVVHARGRGWTERGGIGVVD
ncbi:MAG: tetratricopeptide repeat protein [Planctomycetes bacterium]|nr:tetratricopeptide repeat protein [Planctomycetota bacterium]MBI3845162.1 tetratricopeptide repeat protein [Planctomycetota bacterium]